SPTATFCCLLPLGTIAYTATHSPRRTRTVHQQTHKLGAPARERVLSSGRTTSQRVTREGVGNTEGQYYGCGDLGAKRRPAPRRAAARSALASPLLLDRHVLHVSLGGGLRVGRVGGVA